MSTTTPKGGSQTDLFVVIWGFLAETQLRRRGPVATNWSGDKTWVYHYQTCSKQQSGEWKHPSSPETKNSKSLASTGKLMLLLFWGCKCLILEYYLGQGCIIQWNIDIKAEAIESQQVQSFAVQGGYFSLQLSTSTFCSTHCWSNQAAEIWTAPTPPT